MYSDNLLMVFIKNPTLGKVKTRLASTVGDEKALSVYKFLLDHTFDVSRSIKSDKAVFYSDFIDINDRWKKEGFDQWLQKGNDLGEKMSNAFLKSFNMGYKKVVIIGSDCLELEKSHINEAFLELEKHDAVIGPAKDGGYYLLGLQKHQAVIFQNKAWSTENVLLDTLVDFSNNKLSYKLLPTLSDIDDESDLQHYSTLFA